MGFNGNFAIHFHQEQTMSNDPRSKSTADDLSKTTKKSDAELVQPNELPDKALERVEGAGIVGKRLQGGLLTGAVCQ
jgi:hypothetical protein